MFPILDGNGTSYQRVIRPLAVAADGTSLEVVVPLDAVTGPVGIVGDRLGNQPWLQIVPVVTNGDFRSIAADRSTASVRLQGLGFIEGNETTYTFGEVSVIDRSLTGGPNSGWFFTHDNDGVDLTLPTGGDNFHGAVTVTTAGGTSAPWSVGFTELVSTAMNGTPADGNEASANAGQVVNILGTGLHAGTDILGRYVDSNGTNITQLLNPFYANADGTMASFVLPTVYNGAFSWHVAGSAESHVLQVVPTLDSGDVVSGNARTRLRGTGLLENDSVYSFGGVELVDPDEANRVDVRSLFAHDNDAVDLDLPVSSFGFAEVRTPGGTSNRIPWNTLSAGFGDLRDVSYDGTDIWVATLSGQLHRLSASTGASLGELPLPDGSSSGVGLQVLGSGMVLNGVSVPAGSLLVSNWNGSPDRITALSPAGEVLSTLVLAENLDPIALAYDAADGGHLYVYRSVDADEIIEVNTTNGSVVERIALPLPFPGTNAGGLTIDPVTGNFWVGGSSAATLAEVRRDGTLVRVLDLSQQGDRERVDRLGVSWRPAVDQFDVGDGL